MTNLERVRSARQRGIDSREPSDFEPAHRSSARNVTSERCKVFNDR